MFGVIRSDTGREWSRSESVVLKVKVGEARCGGKGVRGRVSTTTRGVEQRGLFVVGFAPLWSRRLSIRQVATNRLRCLGLILDSERRRSAGDQLHTRATVGLDHLTESIINPLVLAENVDQPSLAAANEGPSDERGAVVAVRGAVDRRELPLDGTPAHGARNRGDLGQVRVDLRRRELVRVWLVATAATAATSATAADRRHLVLVLVLLLIRK